MTEAKHTPGPWTVEPHGGTMALYSGRFMGLHGRHGLRLMNLDDGDHNFEANARLIAAAPDLLEALIMVRDADDDCKRDGLPTIPSIARATIDAAISKATTPQHLT